MIWAVARGWLMSGAVKAKFEFACVRSDLFPLRAERKRGSVPVPAEVTLGPDSLKHKEPADCS